MHCRHAARIAARDKRKRLLLRGGAVAIVFGTFIAAGALGATALRGKSRRASEAAANAPVNVAAATDPQTSPIDSVVAPPTANPAAAPVASQGDPVKRMVAPLSPVVPTGESQLTPDIMALRADSVVVLTFDNQNTRTRIPEKFEQLVRATLPAVYGHAVDSVLAKFPQGGIKQQGDLLSQLPSKGVRIPIGNVWAIRLYPETRPGQDGPLVIRYRVSVVSTSE